MRIEPLPGLRVSICADLDVRASGFMVHNVPALPAVSVVWRILGRTILIFTYQIPFPRAFLLWKSFPGFVPQFVWP